MDDQADEARVMQSLIDCAEHFKLYRGIESQELSRQRMPDCDGIDPADGKILQGNLGTCALLNSNGLIMNSLIAPSFTISHDLREYQRDQWFEGREISSSIASLIESDAPEPPTKIWVSGSAPNSPVAVFDASILATKPMREADSEWILLNVVNDLLERDKAIEVDTVVLMTERIPCESCTAVILEFLKRHLEIRVIVAFWHGTKASTGTPVRGFKHFKDDVLLSSDRDRLKAYKVVGVDGEMLHCMNQPI